MPRIFISYRRADSDAYAGRLHDRLVTEFGAQNVFKDVFDIGLGDEFPQTIGKEIASSDIVLVLIGRDWLTVTEADGTRRIDNPADYVRIEIESALSQPGTRIIPVLVGHASMPSPADLPHSLSRLAFINGMTLRNDPDFSYDFARLAEGIRKTITTSEPRRATPASPSRRMMFLAGSVLVIIVIAFLLLQSGFVGTLFGGQESTAIAAISASSETPEPSPTPTPTDIPPSPTPTTSPSPTPTPTDIPPSPTSTTIPPSLTPTAVPPSPTSTAIPPSLTPTALPLPTVARDPACPALAQSPVRLTPRQYVENYYRLINQERYRETWCTLTQRFIDEFNSQGYDASYLSFWARTVRSVDVFVTNDNYASTSDCAVVVLNLVIYTYNGGSSSVTRYAKLRLDPGSNNWLYDDSSEFAINC